MSKVSVPTKILFIDNDEISFQFQKCMAQIIEGLPQIELHYAADATEGLAMLDSVHPDVVILEHEDEHEQQLFLDSLNGLHPPILVEKDESSKLIPRTLNKVDFHSPINQIPRSDSLESIHQKLIIAIRLGSEKANILPEVEGLH